MKKVSLAILGASAAAVSLAAPAEAVSWRPPSPVEWATARGSGISPTKRDGFNYLIIVFDSRSVNKLMLPKNCKNLRVRAAVDKDPASLIDDRDTEYDPLLPMRLTLKTKGTAPVSSDVSLLRSGHLKIKTRRGATVRFQSATLDHQGWFESPDRMLRMNIRSKCR